MITTPTLIHNAFLITLYNIVQYTTGKVADDVHQRMIILAAHIHTLGIAGSQTVGNS